MSISTQCTFDSGDTSWKQVSHSIERWLFENIMCCSPCWVHCCQLKFTRIEAMLYKNYSKRSTDQWKYLTFRYESLLHLDMWTTSWAENILALWVFSRQLEHNAWPRRIQAKPNINSSTAWVSTSLFLFSQITITIAFIHEILLTNTTESEQSRLHPRNKNEVKEASNRKF